MILFVLDESTEFVREGRPRPAALRDIRANLSELGRLIDRG
jgi:hypothetical protein